ncbi:phosphatidate cytidylyltransferase [Methanobacterium alkalithermotolerans]|uniref:Phosphatidate cytidylyltransferase n=1 Tax=Methanobacterium alkalithermotolerans TaxID=2731220 RepID=A0A8T8K496_9EURY|nr:phosphatidate cytidylyltransferase [Methanobacterium alkalithermotolerans]
MSLVYKRELIRQLIHASGILFIFLGNYLPVPYLILLSLVAMVSGELIFQIDKKYYIPFFSKILRSCRRDEKEKGFIYFFSGLTLTLAFFGFNMAIANAAIIILVLGDATSTLVGKKIGKNKLPHHLQKSWQGSFSFFMVSFIGAATQVPLAPAFIGALAGAITEAYSPLDDNIAIPVVSGTAITLIIYLFF